MLTRIKSMLGTLGADADAPTADVDQALRLASAALLVEAAMLDGAFEAAEQKTIEALLRDHFQLNDTETTALIDDAKAAVAHASELYTFARTIKDTLTPEERIPLIEMLWEVAYADGVVHAYESNLVRRVAGLVYVSDRDSGEARKRVSKRLETVAKKG